MLTNTPGRNSRLNVGLHNPASRIDRHGNVGANELSTKREEIGRKFSGPVIEFMTGGNRSQMLRAAEL